MGTDTNTAQSTTRLRLARVAGLFGGLTHLVVPQLTVLPMDPYGPTVGMIEEMVALGLIGIVAVIGVLLVGRLPTLGRILLATAAFVSVLVVAWEFRPVVLLLSVPLVLTVVVLFAPATGEMPSIESRRSAIGAIAIGSYIVWRMVSTYDRKYSATHADSVVVKPVWQADWMWVGATKPDGATVCAGGLLAGSHLLTYWSQDLAPLTVTAQSNRNGVARFELADLDAATSYEYRVGSATGGADASFRTPAVGAQNLRIAFGSCARTGSNGAVFDAIRATNPDVFVQLGDLHYGNLTSTSPADHITVLGLSLSTPAQSALYSSVPSMWIWDDHDFGPNNSDSTSPAREAVLSAYRQAVPHWGIDPDEDKPINQAFTVGRVRILSSDTRSSRTTSTMLGAEQEAWLINELVESSRTHALVVWAMPTPWNYPDIPGSDVWGGFPEERRRIANAIAAEGITNIVMISGDWHLSAIDDGTNTGYADDGSPGFPLIHGAPLDRPGSRTNDPYSHGVFSNAGQFGAIDVTDDGGATIDVALTVHLWTGEQLGQHRYQVSIPHL